MEHEEKKDEKRILVIRADADFFKEVEEQLQEAGFIEGGNLPSYAVRDGMAIFCGEIDDTLISRVETIPHILGITVWGGLFEQARWTEELEKLGESHTAGFIEYLNVMNRTIADNAGHGDRSYSMPIAVFLFLVFSMDKSLFMAFVEDAWEQTIRQCYEHMQKNNPAISVRMDIAILAFEGFWVAYEERFLAIENEVMDTIAGSVRRIPPGTTIH